MRRRRLVALVSGVMLADAMLYAAITPLLPHYVEELGISSTAAGILSGSYAVGILLGSLVAGWLTTRIGARRTLLLGLGLLALSGGVFAFANQIVALDTARFLQGVGGACSWAGGFAWLITVATPGDRGRLIGIAMAAALGGLLMGPVLGGSATLIGPEIVFTFVSVFALALAVVALATPGSTEPSAALLTLRSLPNVLRHTVGTGARFIAVPAIFSGILVVLSPLELDDVGASGLSIGALFLVAGAIGAAASVPSGKLSDARGALFPIRLGLYVSALTGLGLALADSRLPFMVLVPLALGALGFYWTPAMTLLSYAAERGGIAHGVVFATFNVYWAGGQFAGSVGAGYLADVAADTVAFLAITACSVVTLLVVKVRRV